MEVAYLCPYCKSEINVKGNVILLVKEEGNHKNQGLVLFHEEIGNYNVAISNSLKVKTGDVVDFYCPVCHAKLNIEKGDNLASFIHVDKDGIESNIVISRKYGEKITFQVDQNKEIRSYGENLRKYIDPEWFL